MSIAHGIVYIINAIIDGILTLFDIIVGCLTCRRGATGRGWRFRRDRRHHRRRQPVV